jgi:hypothetical protein
VEDIKEEHKFFMHWTCKTNKKIKLQIEATPELAGFLQANG